MNKWLNFLKKALASLLLIGFSVQAHAVAFQAAADVQAGGGYSEQQGAEGSWGEVGHVQVIPMWKFGSNDFLVTALDASDSGRGVVSDVGNTLPAYFTQSLILTGEPQWKHLIGQSGWSVTAYGLATHGYLQDDPDEYLGEGIYDYEQYGGGIKVDKSDLWPWLHALDVDLSDGHRHFPNYYNTPTDNRNYYTQDLWQLEGQISATLPHNFLLYYSLTDYAYNDSYVFNSDGTISDTLRMDLDHDLKLSWNLPLSQQLNFGVFVEGTYVNSNYDTYNFNANEFLPDYFSDSSIGIGPSVAWYPKGDPKGDMLSLTWEPKYTNYNHRVQYNPDGTPTQGTEDDFENTFTFFGRKTLLPHWSLYCSLDYDTQQSNQASINGVIYSYAIFDSQLGLEFQY